MSKVSDYIVRFYVSFDLLLLDNLKEFQLKLSVMISFDLRIS